MFRTSYTRPLYNLCINNNIDFTSLELIKESNDCYRINEFPNCLPHDIDYHHHRMTKLWSKTNLGNKERQKIGASFYENRREGILTRDRQVYTSNQVVHKLPDNFDKSKNNIVIFNSSEDEFAAIGDIFEDKAVFKTQEKGVKWICETLEKYENYRVYLKIHPNLNSINYDYVERLLLMSNSHKNLTVIPGDSTVSTYSIMDESDKVIVFGSSTGVEANYWGKPVINLASSFYYYLNIAYKPKAKEELKKLLLSDYLKTKPKKESIIYGFYLMNYKSYTQSFNTLKRSRTLGINTGLGLPYYKILGSKSLFNIINLMYKKKAHLLGKKELSIPKKDIAEKQK